MLSSQFQKLIEVIELNSKILKFLNTTAGQLGFALLSGFGYLALISGFILELSRGIWLLLLYISPIVVCGAALVIVKLMKQARENENNKSILKLFWMHVVVIIIGIIFAIALFA